MHHAVYKLGLLFANDVEAEMGRLWQEGLVDP